jgi:hypothetical protein
MPRYDGDIERHIDELRELARRNGRRAGMEEAALICEYLKPERPGDVREVVAKSLQVAADAIRKASTKDGAQCPN